MKLPDANLRSTRYNHFHSVEKQEINSQIGDPEIKSRRGATNNS